ncbi:hypothetical protein JKF63_04218 [Porcisia hertigi]|uniref:Uncharacterized protein n=1 Tax=Porcisia hertigi TaxID=2761500 RepID=A0A836IDZ1_9TRYP|nr:hypothetical protein JKF63_04213 [Porcisia hertigi]KAG5501945.1 hypothetical protein JKF63_04215 [Porcisia hertigi]KAG5501948.1 hypothetical protein JKF63_04218 [Porcisia hertigi]
MLFHRIPSVARTAAVPGQRKHSRSAICLHHFACTCAARESGACVRAVNALLLPLLRVDAQRDPEVREMCCACAQMRMCVTAANGAIRGARGLRPLAGLGAVVRPSGSAGEPFAVHAVRAGLWCCCVFAEEARDDAAESECTFLERALVRTR